MKTLIVYYSLDGGTQSAAEFLAKELSADLLRLVADKEIPKEGFGKFMQGGTPIWAGKPVPAINTFIKDKAHRERPSQNEEKLAAFAALY